MKLNRETILKILNAVAWSLALILLVYLLRKIKLTDAPIDWSQIIELVGIMIWPLTCLVIIILFKAKISNLFSKVENFKITKDGVEASFQNKLESVQELLGAATGGGISKSGKKINIKGSDSTPYNQLLEIKDALNSQIQDKAKEFNLETKGLTLIEISDKLKEIGAMTLQKAKLFNALVDLTNSGNPAISQAQVNQVKTLYLSLQL